ncbi:MAG: hypothetical protein EKK48_10510 [Candidatus Melainabacteria bacterium]|nr:MAG: hypothetical protein EKK48_10510 [Candidatus Melainabacteria bacterium]
MEARKEVEVIVGMGNTAASGMGVALPKWQALTSESLHGFEFTDIAHIFAVFFLNKAFNFSAQFCSLFGLGNDRWCRQTVFVILSDGTVHPQWGDNEKKGNGTNPFESQIQPTF